ncbi:hypothetical protein CEP54_012929 [Fusarium duplospermum]|uniref:Uncharacterized protein n=1 Tax=Fusarium duplospermum TaxID=1325734 RepID=A0A428P5V2_9HYPO|nr:hypothetical protein CEP54_012929 [Fusarium duplospermum]
MVPRLLDASADDPRLVRKKVLSSKSQLEQELKVDEQGKVQLPVLTLQDSEQVDETRRVVYQRKSTDAAPTPPRLEQTAQGQMLDEWKAEEITAKGAVVWVEP